MLAPRPEHGRVAAPSFPSTRMVAKVSLFGLWLSLVERAVRVGEVQGSNPCSPIALLMIKPRWACPVRRCLILPSGSVRGRHDVRIRGRHNRGIRRRHYCRIWGRHNRRIRSGNDMGIRTRNDRSVGRGMNRRTDIGIRGGRWIRIGCRWRIGIRCRRRIRIAIRTGWCGRWRDGRLLGQNIP
jgi:hypothetical protein